MPSCTVQMPVPKLASSVPPSPRISAPSQLSIQQQMPGSVEETDPGRAHGGSGVRVGGECEPGQAQDRDAERCERRPEQPADPAADRGSDEQGGREERQAHGEQPAVYLLGALVEGRADGYDVQRGRVLCTCLGSGGKGQGGTHGAGSFCVDEPPRYLLCQ